MTEFTKQEFHGMIYNAMKDNMIIPEYGRNIQLLIQHAKTIEDKKEKQAYVEQMVNLIQQMHPQYRNVDEYRIKLWAHVYRIADYELDGVQPTEGGIPTIDDIAGKPDRLEYPQSMPRFRHYGRNVQSLINKAIEMEEGPKKQGFVQSIASYMKLAYRTWNREHFVSDEVILNDLATLSDGKLELAEELSIIDTFSGRPPRRKTHSGGHKRTGGRNYRSNNRGGGSNNRGGGKSRGSHHSRNRRRK